VNRDLGGSCEEWEGGGRGSERIEREGKPPFDSEGVEVEEIGVEAGLSWCLVECESGGKRERGKRDESASSVHTSLRRSKTAQ